MCWLTAQIDVRIGRKMLIFFVEYYKGWARVGVCISYQQSQQCFLRVYCLTKRYPYRETNEMAVKLAALGSRWAEHSKAGSLGI